MRGLKVARAFSAFENNVAFVKTDEEVEAELKQKYVDKMKLNEINIPDTFKLHNGWIDEEEGIAY